MPDPHPEDIRITAPGEHLLLWGMRAWAHSVEQGACPFRLLVPVFSQMGATRSTIPFHRSMSALYLGGADLCPLARLENSRIHAKEAELLLPWQEILAGHRASALRTLEQLVSAGWVVPCAELMMTTIDALQQAQPGLFPASNRHGPDRVARPSHSPLARLSSGLPVSRATIH